MHALMRPYMHICILTYTFILYIQTPDMCIRVTCICRRTNIDVDNLKRGVIFAHFLHVFSSIRRLPIHPKCFTHVRNIRLSRNLPETSYLRK